MNVVPPRFLFRQKNWIAKNPILVQQYADVDVWPELAYLFWRRDVTPETFLGLRKFGLDFCSVAELVLVRKRVVQDVERWDSKGYVVESVEDVTVVPTGRESEEEFFAYLEITGSRSSAKLLAGSEVSYETVREWSAAGLDLQFTRAVEFALEGVSVQYLTQLLKLGSRFSRLNHATLTEFVELNLPLKEAEQWLKAGAAHQAIPIAVRTLKREGFTAQQALDYFSAVRGSCQFYADDFLNFSLEDVAFCLQSQIEPEQVARYFLAGTGSHLIYDLRATHIIYARRHKIPPFEMIEWATHKKVGNYKTASKDWRNIVRWRKALGADAIHYAVAGLTIKQAKKAAKRGELNSIRLLNAFGS